MKTIFWIILSALTFILIIWSIYKYGKKQLKEEDEYEALYEQISWEINDRDKDQHNYDILMYKLGKLEKLKYKNEEKTSILRMNIKKEFEVFTN
jgi:hypothetical protein